MSKVGDRTTKLLGELAEGFGEGHDRMLETEWLGSNAVSLTELYGLSEIMGLVLRAYLRLPQDVQLAMLLIGADKEKSIDPVRVLAYTLYGVTIKEVASIK